MLKKLALGFGLALAAIAIAIPPALAYSGTPGTSASCASVTVAAGGSVICTAHFPSGAGLAVTYSATGGGAGCTVTFSPSPTRTTDASGNVTVTVTFGSKCTGVLSLTAVAGAQNVTTTVTITGFPGASSSQFGVPAPIAWVAILLAGVALVGAALFSFRRREPGA
jgi:hypothetical protein